MENIYDGTCISDAFFLWIPDIMIWSRFNQNKENEGTNQICREPWTNHRLIRDWLRRPPDQQQYQHWGHIIGNIQNKRTEKSNWSTTLQHPVIKQWLVWSAVPTLNLNFQTRSQTDHRRELFRPSPICNEATHLNLWHWRPPLTLTEHTFTIGCHQTLSDQN